MFIFIGWIYAIVYSDELAVIMMKTILYFSILIITHFCFAQNSEVDSIREFLRSNSFEGPLEFENPKEDILGEWVVIGLYRKMKKASELESPFTMGFSKKEVFYRTDTSSFERPYALYKNYNKETKEYKIVQLEIEGELKEVFVIMYFDKKYMVIERFVEKKTRNEKRSVVKFENYYILQRL